MNPWPPASGKPFTRVRHLAALWTGRSVLHNVNVLFRAGRVEWVGPGGSDICPDDCDEFDGSGLIGMPGLFDCHTHAIWAGTRLGDFVRRLGGESYASLLEGGGGIHTTVHATAAASDADLHAHLAARLATMLDRGVTTVEIKSGYGLTIEAEARLLRIARSVASPQRRVTTFLGAHAIPPDRSRADYVDEVCGPMLAACAPFADAIDVYCDRGAFTLAEAERILLAGKSAGLAVKVHAEQVEFTGAAAMAARLGALSCDHLERIDDAGIAAMAASGSVAVLLPGAMLYLRDPPPPVAKLRAAGVPLAVATDFNPGSSPVSDLWTCATLACLTMGLTPEEALAGITSVAARALGCEGGVIEPGSPADLAIFAPPPGEIPDPRVLVQYMGGHAAKAVWIGGERVR